MLASSIGTFLAPHKGSEPGWIMLVVGGCMSLLLGVLGASMLLRVLLPQAASPTKSPALPKPQGRIRRRTS